MDQFMLIFHNIVTEENSFSDPSSEAIQAELAKWNVWIGWLAAQEKMVGTQALMPTGKTISGKARIVTDGPFTEAKEIVGGYAIITAASLDEAVALTNGCPMFEANGRVEVRPIVVFG